MNGMAVSKKIILLVPHFGSLPWYFKYFAHSCSFNPSVDFLIIADDKSYGGKTPKNISFVYQAFDDFKNLIADKLKMRVIIQNAYKLCDFRPAYGVIFEEYIGGYDFWGYCDIDIILGNIENFITKNILSGYDIISVRPEYISGFFTIYRNNDILNNLFRKSKDHGKIFSSPGYFGFDECGLHCDELQNGQSLESIDSNIESLTHVVRRMARRKKIKAYFDLHVVEVCREISFGTKANYYIWTRLRSCFITW